MQAWDLVKVNKPDSEHHERAGRVTSFDEESGLNAVELDETTTHDGGQEEFLDSELTLLGR